jgi:hypothetical protein
MPKTLAQGFETMIIRLKPLQSEHIKAASHKDSVKRCMRANFDCHSFFETGSFGNGTGVRHYSDTDYFGVCPDSELSVNSSVTLREVKRALQYTFSSTSSIEVKSPAVRIPFGRYASERLELTPASFKGIVETPMGKKAIYYIPDYNGGWMQSSPAAHNFYVKQEDVRLRGRLKPLIQLLKAWKFYNNVPITSFYLEMKAAKYAAKRNSLIYDCDLYYIIRELYSNSLASIHDPMKISGYVVPCRTQAKKEQALSRLSTAYSRASKAFLNRDKNVDQAFLWWNMFFNGKFPAR